MYVLLLSAVWNYVLPEGGLRDFNLRTGLTGAVEMPDVCTFLLPLYFFSLKTGRFVTSFEVDIILLLELLILVFVFDLTSLDT